MERLPAMRFLARLAATSAACLAALTLTVFAGGGVAHADFRGIAVHNVQWSSRCVTAQIGGAAITQQLCQNAPGELWNYVGDPFSGPIQVRNADTGLCMDISAFQNAGAVVQIDCGLQAFGSYWKVIRAGQFDNGVVKYRLQSASANFCLDLENGLPDIGLSMQVWQCNTNTDNQRWYNL